MVLFISPALNCRTTELQHRQPRRRVVQSEIRCLSPPGGHTVHPAEPVGVERALASSATPVPVTEQPLPGGHGRFTPSLRCRKRLSQHPGSWGGRRTRISETCESARGALAIVAAETVAEGPLDQNGDEALAVQHGDLLPPASVSVAPAAAREPVTEHTLGHFSLASVAAVLAVIVVLGVGFVVVVRAGGELAQSAGAQEVEEERLRKGVGQTVRLWRGGV